MCDYCDEITVSSFVGYEEFEVFEKVLSIELSKGNLVYVKDATKPSNPKGKILGFEFGGTTSHSYTIYKCSTCEQLWHLSDPDYSWRGYFKRQE